jgi:hypothetical protein
MRWLFSGSKLSEAKERCFIGNLLPDRAGSRFALRLR